MPRTLAALALITLASGPLAAQVDVRGLANAGYDLGYGAPSVGVAAEVAWTPAGSPVSVALRPSVDVVFAETIPYVVGFDVGGAGPDQTDSDVTRLGTEVVARWVTAPGPATPYAKVGVAYEHERIRFGDLERAYWQTDAVAGLGAQVGRAYVEGTLGFGDASRHRVVLGLRF